jgi:hypothetical protein
MYVCNSVLYVKMCLYYKLYFDVSGLLEDYSKWGLKESQIKIKSNQNLCLYLHLYLSYLSDMCRDRRDNRIWLLANASRCENNLVKFTDRQL